MRASDTWSPPGAVAPSALEAARLELHWAIQAVDVVGRSLIEPEPDASHIALTWLDELGALASARIADGSRAALRLGSVELLVLDASGHPADRLSLAGITLAVGAAWVRGRMAARLDARPRWARHHPDIPDAPAGHGQPFGPPSAAHAELARWYGNAARALGAVADADSRAGPVRVWPHHFDMATFVNLDPALAQYEGRSVNVGFSPGDATFAEPYFYVVPYPPPAAESLPPLEGPGAWHVEGWLGAVLSAGEVVRRSPEGQRAVVTSFLDHATSVLERALGADDR